MIGAISGRATAAVIGLVVASLVSGPVTSIAQTDTTTIRPTTSLPALAPGDVAVRFSLAPTES